MAGGIRARPRHPSFHETGYSIEPKAHRVLCDQAMRVAGAQSVQIGVSSFASFEQVEAASTDPNRDVLLRR